MKKESIKKVDLRRNPWNETVAYMEEGIKYIGAVEELKEILTGKTEIDYIYFKKTEETLDIFKSACESWEDVNDFRWATYTKASGVNLHEKLDDYGNAYDEFEVIQEFNNGKVHNGRI